MRTVSDDYSSQVRSNTRRFGFYVAVYGNSETPDYLWLDDIISISITRAFSDGIQIGACMSDRLTLTTRATDLFNGRLKKVKIYCRCTDPVTEWHTLGTFYVDSSVTERGITTVNAYDMMGRLGKPVKWTDHTLAAAPTFPCKMQEVLDYLCARAAVTTDFRCQDFTIENAPDGYTARELIGYIAACHGANARFSPDEVLQIRPYTQTGAVIDRNRCYGTDVAADGGYTVKGILFDLGGETRIFIDGSSSEYDPDADGILECFVPFATVASAEYAWSQVGGMSCSACSFTLPAEDIFEVGDVFSSADANGSTVTAAVTEQELSVSYDGGFVERIACAAQGKKNQRDISNRVTAAEEDISEGGGTAEKLQTSGSGYYATTSSENGLIISNGDAEIRIKAVGSGFGAGFEITDQYGWCRISMSGGPDYSRCGIVIQVGPTNITVSGSNGVTIENPATDDIVTVQDNELHVRLDGGTGQLTLNPNAMRIQAGDGVLSMGTGGLVYNNNTIAT
ncbi:MAG: hypothetical protein J6A16_06865 [Oscillospiraceae bacterium]|nr:hypothetical protein [Oscillospiraceae bacterium]